MRRLGYPEKVVRLLESLYKGTFGAVRVGADVTEWFELLLQGCMLSPILFNIFLEVIIASALGALNEGAVMNGRIINNLRFADDIAVLTESQNELQAMITKIAEESGKMGMKINVGKTEVQLIGRERVKVSIHLEHQELKQVEEFVYLGGNMSEDASTDQDLRRRIGMACGAMQSLSCIVSSAQLVLILCSSYSVSE